MATKDYLSDPRLAEIGFMQLKRFLKETIADTTVKKLVDHQNTKVCPHHLSECAC